MKHRQTHILAQWRLETYVNGNRKPWNVRHIAHGKVLWVFLYLPWWRKNFRKPRSCELAFLNRLISIFHKRMAHTQGQTNIAESFKHSADSEKFYFLTYFRSSRKYKEICVLWCGKCFQREEKKMKGEKLSCDEKPQNSTFPVLRRTWKTRVFQKRVLKSQILTIVTTNLCGRSKQNVFQLSAMF